MHKQLLLLTAALMFSSGAWSEPEPGETELAMLSDTAAAQVLLQPSSIIRLDPSEPYVVVASLSEASLSVFENINGFLQQRLQFPISMGKMGFGKQEEGDKKTPVGVYRITSHIADEQLDDFYGRAAYPLDYPNVWDKRNKRTGSGIWVHAMPEGVNSRPTFDSDGCVVLNNDQIDQLAQFVDVGRTKVVLTEKLDWIEADSQTALQDELSAEIESWRLAWQSRSNDDYMKYYSKDFSVGNYNYDSWRDYKSRVNGAKDFIEVNLSNLGLFAYPGEGQLVMAEFYQDYDSSNHSWRGWKKQLWQREGDRWKIIYEAGG